MLLLFSFLFSFGNYVLYFFNYSLVEDGFVIFTAILLTIFLISFSYCLENKYIKLKLLIKLIIIFIFGFLFGLYSVNKDIEYKLPKEAFNQQVYVKGRISSLINKKSKDIK